MKKNFYFLALILLTISSAASATVFRVNNALTENITGRLFKEIQTAHNHFSVKNGDTLMVESSATTYAGFTSTKRLAIIGPGYFLGENSGVNAVVAPAKINGYVYINPGSEGSYIIGMEFNYGLHISASNIYIVRCKGDFAFDGYVNTPTNNCKITSSYCGISGYPAYNSNISVTNSIILYDYQGFLYLTYENNILLMRE